MSYNTKNNIAKRAQSEESFYSAKNEIYDDELIDEKIEKGDYLITMRDDDGSRPSELSNNGIH